eukprot:5522677-Pyramimonas_sp.AAC.2
MFTTGNTNSPLVPVCSRQGTRTHPSSPYVYDRESTDEESESEPELICGKYPKSKDGGKVSRAKRAEVRKRQRAAANLPPRKPKPKKPKREKKLWDVNSKSLRFSLHTTPPCSPYLLPCRLPPFVNRVEPRTSGVGRARRVAFSHNSCEVFPPADAAVGGRVDQSS